MVRKIGPALACLTIMLTAGQARAQNPLENGGTPAAPATQPINPLADGGTPVAPSTNPAALQDLHKLVFLTRNVVHDNMDNRDAFTLLVPTGWKIDSRINWGCDPFFPVTCLWSVYNPAGTEALVQYPLVEFNDGIRQARMLTMSGAGPQAVAAMAEQFADGRFYLGTEIRPRVASPEEYFKMYLVPRYRPSLKDATIVGMEDEPGLAAAAIQAMGNMPGYTVKVSLIHTQYKASGMDVEEDFVVTVGWLPLPGGTVSWGGTACSYRAKKGQLAGVMPILRLIQTSPRMNIQWFNDIEQVKTIMVQMKVNEIRQEAMRSQIVSHLQDKVSTIVQETFLRREKAESSAYKEWDAYIRGAESVPDPNHPGHNVHVPVGYDHVFISGDGTRYIASNEDNFKPDASGNYEELHNR